MLQSDVHSTMTHNACWSKVPITDRPKHCSSLFSACWLYRKLPRPSAVPSRTVSAQVQLPTSYQAIVFYNSFLCMLMTFCMHVSVQRNMLLCPGACTVTCVLPSIKTCIMCITSSPDRTVQWCLLKAFFEVLSDFLCSSEPAYCWQ